ncbi:hypothetical protein AB0J38_24985 [Streptomyces sp. NPDC050095]|uniref:hypothetical protein n=1 Tax=unclassified Streptomyces TaxID=2593676 RepID=UPI003420D9F2
MIASWTTYTDASEALTDVLCRPVDDQASVARLRTIARSSCLTTASTVNSAAALAAWSIRLNAPSREHRMPGRGIARLTLVPHPDDRRLTEPEARAVVGRMLQAIGLNPPGCRDEHPWLALRAEDRHALHVVISLRSLAGRLLHVPGIGQRLHVEARRIEADLGLVPSTTGLRHTGPTDVEFTLDPGLGLSATVRSIHPGARAALAAAGFQPHSDDAVYTLPDHLTLAEARVALADAEVRLRQLGVTSTADPAIAAHTLAAPDTTPARTAALYTVPVTQLTAVQRQQLVGHLTDERSGVLGAVRRQIEQLAIASDPTSEDAHAVDEHERLLWAARRLYGITTDLARLADRQRPGGEPTVAHALTARAAPSSPATAPVTRGPHTTRRLPH